MSNSLLLQKTVLEPKNFLTHVTNWVSLVKGAQVALSIAVCAQTGRPGGS